MPWDAIPTDLRVDGNYHSDKTTKYFPIGHTVLKCIYVSEGCLHILSIYDCLNKNDFNSGLANMNLFYKFNNEDFRDKLTVIINSDQRKTAVLDLLGHINRFYPMPADTFLEIKTKLGLEVAVSGPVA